VRILALETSSLAGTVAALADGRLLGETALDERRRSARSLAPAMADQLRSVGWQPRDVELVAVTRGPGSFTGLRIGVTTAKTFAYAVGAEILGVSTLEAIARQVPPGDAPVWAVLDAQRGELYSAFFERGADGMKWLRPEAIVAAERWLAELTEGAVVAGPGLRRVRDRLPPSIVVAPEEGWQPRAATVGRIAWEQYCAGRRDDVWKLVPHYLRRPAAEEKGAGKPGPRSSAC
jgi:tRNA threonylcarbamoyladenosine biosynthesis protein TsaB